VHSLLVEPQFPFYPKLATLESSVTNIDLVGNAFSSNKPYLFRAIYEWILDNNGTPYILVDANQTNVQVPQEHVKDGQIILNVSPNAIQGWHADNDAISFSARFSGKAQQLYIPMLALLAVYAQENSLGMAFPEALEQPEEEQSSFDEELNQESSDEVTAELKEVTSAPELSELSKNQKKPASKKNENKSHLKVIK
jgi:stringent starvation protein B